MAWVQEQLEDENIFPSKIGMNIKAYMTPL